MSAPTQQDPAYEYCLGSEALKKWGPKTEGMEFKDRVGHWIPTVFFSSYEEDTYYRRKRQTPVQHGEEWIESNVRTPKREEFPVFCVISREVQFCRSIDQNWSFSHWKPAKLPAPPKSKQKTQQEIDAAWFTEFWQTMPHGLSLDMRAKNHGWTCACAALAWERSRGKEDGK